MANIMSQLNLKNKPSRNGFDLSKKRAFTAKVGELLPVYVREVMPGDKFNIKQEWFTRTMPVNTAAYTRILEYYDWFFVPLDQLWKYANQFYSNMVDSPVAASDINTGNLMGDFHPYMSSDSVYKYLQSIRPMSFVDDNPDISEEKDILGYWRCLGSGKLLWYLGYGMNFYNFASTPRDPNTTPTDEIDNLVFKYPLNPFPLLAYQKIYNDFYRDQNWEKAQPWTFNVDYLNGSTQSSMSIPLDDLDSGNNTNMFDLRYCNWNKDLFTGVLPNAQYGDVAAIDITMMDTDDVSRYIFKKGYLGPVTYNGNASSMLLRPTSVPEIGSGVPTGSSLAITGSTDAASVNRQVPFQISSEDYNNLFSSINAIALRKLEALQKYKEIINSGTKSWNTVIEDIYGVNIDSKLSSNVYFLKGFRDKVDISEVVNQTFPGEGQQADIAGKGTGAGRDSLEFDASWYGNRPGVLMCVYHSVPLLDYATGGVQHYCTKTNISDYANPVFDKLGMQSIPMRELTTSNLVWQTLKENQVELPNDPSEVMLGFAPRYIDYKTDYDDVVGAFCHSLGSWTAPISTNYLVSYIKAALNYLDIRNNLKTFIHYPFFKVNPAVLNPIFANQIDGNHNDVDTDQFLINMSLDIKAVRNLDVNGLPY